MPPIVAAGHVVEFLFEIGPFRSGGMGPVPICDADLIHWQLNQGIELSAWECSEIIRLSSIYVSGLSKYKPQSIPAPWVSAPRLDGVKAANDAMQSWLKRMSKKQ